MAKKLKCASCGMAVKKMAKGGSNSKMGIYGVPQENVGTSSQYMPTAKKGAIVKKSNGGPKEDPIYTMGSRKVRKNLFGNTVVKEKGMEYDPITKEMATVKTKRVIPKNIKPGDTRKDVIRKKTIVTKDALDNLKVGGASKTKKLAALAKPTNKVTRADIIAGALKNKRKKK